MGARGGFLIVTKSLTAMTNEAKTGTKPQGDAQNSCKRPATALLRLGSVKLEKLTLSPAGRNKNLPVILYDLEAYGDNNRRKEPKPTLTIENAHVPISVSIGDTLERVPTHICERDPTELVRAQVWAEFMPEDVASFRKCSVKNWGMVGPGACRRVQLGQLRSKRDQKPFRGPSCRHSPQSQRAKNGNKIMFLLTWGFRVLDIINYLSPGTSYERLMKAHERT